MINDIRLDFGCVPKEFNLVLATINGDCKNLDVICKRIGSELDWNLFFDLAIHHRVYPLIYSKLKVINSEWIPKCVLDKLGERFKWNTFQMLHLTAEMEKISQLLSEKQIRILILKGPVLASDLYGDLSLRTCSDIDILVPIKDLKSVDQLLSKRGYIKNNYIQTVLGDWKWRHHHVTYSNPQNKAKIEIHWRLNPGPGKEPSFDELWERKRLCTITSSPVYFLGKEDLFLFLVSHGARHGWSRLRWLTDIDQILKQKIDWRQLIIILKKFQCLHLGGQALILCSQLLNSEILDEAKPLLLGNRPKELAQEAIFYFEKMVNLHTQPVSEIVSTYHERYLFSLRTTRQKVIFMLSTWFPYPEDVKTFPLPKQLHFLYFPLRPFLCVWRKLRSQLLFRGSP